MTKLSCAKTISQVLQLLSSTLHNTQFSSAKNLIKCQKKKLFLHHIEAILYTGGQL